MRKIFGILLLVSVFGACSYEKVQEIAVFTGGHDYDSINFFRAFESYEDISFDHLIHPGANDIYTSDSLDKYDALVFYDLYQEISQKQKSAFLEMLNKGKGLVFLHHSIASYQDWDEFMKILGARYYLQPSVYNGDSVPASTYSHGQDILVEVLDNKHPVSVGLEDFELHEEVYGNYIVIPGMKTLMVTDHPDSGRELVWVNEYGKSRIVYIQLGHDNNAFSNENFRQLLRQAIRWVSR